MGYNKRQFEATIERYEDVVKKFSKVTDRQVLHLKKINQSIKKLKFDVIDERTSLEEDLKTADKLSKLRIEGSIKALKWVERFFK